MGLYLLATWRVMASAVEGSSNVSVSYICNRSRSLTVYHMYIAMLEPQPATGGPTSSVEAEERLFHSLAVDTKKLFLCKSELQCGIKYCWSCLLVMFVWG